MRYGQYNIDSIKQALEMPPKIFKKPAASSGYSAVVNPNNSEAGRKSQEKEQSDQTHEQLFVNPKNLMSNAKTLQRIRILISFLSGILSGLLNIPQLMGPFVYIFAHVLMTGMVVLQIGDISKYFMKKTDIWGGIGSGVTIYLCAWMIVYNIVYTL